MGRRPMRAFVYHGANSGSGEEMPDPVPADGELLVEVLVTGYVGLTYTATQAIPA